MILNILEKLGLIRKKDKSSKNVAKERLQFILVQDRVNLSPAEMEELQEDLYDVLSRYIDIDERQIEMEVNREDDMMALVANFPIK